jgi:signal transduction histidine kinase
MNIFARSLLSFWLTTLLTVGLTAIIVRSLDGAHNPHAQAIPLRQLETCGQTLVNNLARDGSRKAAGPRLNRNCSIRYLYSPSGERIMGEEPPGDVAHLLRMQAADPRTPVVDLVPGTTKIVFSFPTSGGNYTAVSVRMRSPHDIPILFYVNLLMAVAISAFVIWLLAGQFSQPIRGLQRFAECVASGDIDARPSHALMRRKDELGELGRSVDAMVTRILELMTAQKAFLGQVSHELGSPLTRLNLALALAKRKAPLELAPELRRLEDEAAELNVMIQQLLLLARLENATEYDSLAECFSIAELVHQVAGDAQFEARQSGKDVRVDCSDGERWVWATVRGRRDLLKRAFDNILRNAIRFTDLGSCVEVTWLVISETYVQIYVRDHGPGVAQTQLEAIFEPFVRLKGQPDGSGAGLGLAIAKKAISLHGGEVQANLAQPQGLVVTVGLPLVAATLAMEAREAISSI